MTSTIDGPRLAAASGRTKALVVFLHGYGADGNDLIEIGRQWQPWLPDADFIAPHAPSRCAQSPTGREWFPLLRRDPQEITRGVLGAAPGLDSFLESELEKRRLAGSRLVLVGFSQGTMMALHVGLRRTFAPAAVVGYSGALPAPDRLSEATGKPPILLVHGDADQVVPIDALFTAADALGEAGIPCQWHLSLGVAHGIDAEGLRQGGLFAAEGLRAAKIR